MKNKHYIRLITALTLLTIIITLSFTYSKEYTGVASFYSNKFINRKTATGNVYKCSNLTAASNVIALNQYVKVINISNDKYVIVKINDRMKRDSKRIIDLSRIAAKKLDIINEGIASVKILVLNNRADTSLDNTL